MPIPLTSRKMSPSVTPDPTQETQCRMKLRLGYHYHLPALRRGGRVIMPGYQGKFLDGLAKHCESLTCFLHDSVDFPVERLDYQISAQNIRWVSLGNQRTVPIREILSWKLSSVVRRHRNDFNVMLLRGPSPLLSAIAKACGPIPIALLLVGDYTKGIDDLPQPRWRKEAIRCWADWNKRRQLKVARNALTFVNSRALYDELRPSIHDLVEVRTSTLSEEDFFQRDDTCEKARICLLYAGRIEAGKGILDIARAVARLVERGYDIEFGLVGWANEADTILDDLLKFAEASGIGDRIKLLGFKALGHELFEAYREADIFVLGSRAAEGFPRTIWEAMANSLPVIATRVGSIPQFIEDAATLVEPSNVGQLTAAIEQLITTPALRQSHIKRGLKLAKQNTIEIQARRMVSLMEERLENLRGSGSPS